jgi:regulator of sirC expression with transglutaminase-like and TPR domain
MSKPMFQKIKEAFACELAKQETQLDLAQAALLLSEYLTQPFDCSAYLARLDQMAEETRSVVAGAITPLQQIEALNNYIFGQLNFLGNSGNYYLPDNSFLNRVLDTKTGIPISLSVIYLEVGRRLALPLWGIGMPGHFIVGGGSRSKPIYIDVFNRGALLSEDECLAICHVSPTERQAFRERYLQPSHKKAILFRMLLNLKQIYVRRESWLEAYKTVDLMLLVYPTQLEELRDRGLLAYRLGRLQEAIFDLNRYLFLRPTGQDIEWLAERVEKMEEKLMRLN